MRAIDRSMLIEQVADGDVHMTDDATARPRFLFDKQRKLPRAIDAEDKVLQTAPTFRA